MDLTFFQQYLEHEKRYSKHTVKSYINDLEQYAGFLKHEMQTDVDTASHHQIKAWIVSLMEEGITSRTVNRKISTLRTFYRYLLITNVRSDNPVSKVVTPKVSKKLPVFVDENSMDNLLEQMDFPDTFGGVRDRLVLDVFYQTGIRLSELINIKEGDVGVDTIKVIGKRNKERLVPISNNLAKSIQIFSSLKQSEVPDSEEFLMVTDGGKKLYEKFVYRLVNKYLSKTTSLSKKSPHVLRHTFATHMLNNGADLNAIKEILGHANLSATQIYTHNNIDKLKQVHNLAHPRGKPK